MAKGKAKLRVIAGGGKPGRAVITKTTRPQTPAPARRAPVAARPAEPVPPEESVEETEETEEAAPPPKTELPRVLIFAALAVAIAGAAYIFTRGPTHTTQPAPPSPQLSATKPAEWAAQPLPPAPSPSASP